MIPASHSQTYIAANSNRRFASQSIRVPAISSIRSIPSNWSNERIAMTVVTLAHLVAFLFILHPFHSASPAPVLSFSVTLMDMTSTPNPVSVAASVSTVAKPEPKEKPQEVVKQKQARRVVKHIPKPVTQPASPVDVQAQTHNAQNQTAVLSALTPAQFDAAYLRNPTPSYPALSRRMHEQGKVLLHVYVDQAGRAATIELKQSSGFDRLDHAALESVKSWRFAPAKQGETVMASWVTVPVNFILE